MKRRTIELLICFLVGMISYGQAPNWSVNENNFEYTMSFVAFVTIDGTNLSSTNDQVAAFSNGEIRGVTNLIYVESKNRYYAYLTVFSNANNEAINFKVYNSATDTVVDIEKTINFEIGAHYGDLLQAFSVAKPVLNNETALIRFDFDKVDVVNKATSGNTITLIVEERQSVTALNAVFVLSAGAQLLKQGVKVESGNNALDFSSPITFNLLSEDESKRVEWTISVSSNAAIGNLVFYKKDAVCYKGGAIKVQSSESGSTVSLIKGQTSYATQSLVNGEAIFNNLSTGSYTVKVNGFSKNIIINLKE